MSKSLAVLFHGDGIVGFNAGLIFDQAIVGKIAKIFFGLILIPYEALQDIGLIWWPLDPIF